MADQNEIDVKVKATTTGLTDGMNAATKDVREFSEQAQGHLNGLTQVIGNVQAPVEALTAGFGGLVGALAGGAIAEAVGEIAEKARELYEYGVEKPIEMAEAWGRLGYQMGLTAEQAQTLEAASKLSGTSQEQLSTWVNMASRALRSNMAQIEAQGDAALTAAAKGGNFIEYLKAVNDHAKEMASPIERGEFLTLALGRSGAQGQEQLNRFAEALGGASDEAKKFGFDLGEGDVKAMEDFQKARGELQLGVEGLEIKMGRGLIPVVTQLMTAIGDTGAFDLLGQAIAGLSVGINDGTEILFEWEERLITGMGLVKDFAEIMPALTTAISTGQWNDARDIIHHFSEGVKADVADMTNTINASATAAQAFDEKIASSLHGGGQGDNSLGPEGGNKKYVAPGSGKEDDSAFKAMMDANKKSALEYEQQMEALYRENVAASEKGSEERVEIIQREMLRVLGMFGAGSKEYLGMQKALTTALREQEAERANEAMAASEIVIKTEERSVAERVKLVKDQAQLGVISNQEELADLLKLENERFAVVQAEMYRELSLAGTTQAKRRELLAKAKEDEQRHADSIAAIQEQSARASLDAWMRFFGPMSQQFQGMLDRWLAGTGKFKLTFDNVMASARQSAAHVVASMVTDWVTGEIRKTVATVVQARIRDTAEKESALKSVALAVWTGLKWIAIQAYKAAAGAYQAIVGIPYVGPILAPIAAGVALAGVLALGSKIASAKGGYDIPSGVNPIVQTHEQEMILPKEPANVLRNLAQGPMGQVGTGTSGNAPHYHFHIHALDAADADDFFQRNGESLAREMHRQQANYNFGRRA